MRRLRAGLAHLVWLVCAGCAVLLGVGALLVALRANPELVVVDALLRAADFVDFGVLSREDGPWQVRGQGADVKNALLNWGSAALGWLVAGFLLVRLLRR